MTTSKARKKVFCRIQEQAKVERAYCNKYRREKKVNFQSGRRDNQPNVMEQRKKRNEKFYTQDAGLIICNKLRG